MMKKPPFPFKHKPGCEAKAEQFFSIAPGGDPDSVDGPKPATVVKVIFCVNCKGGVWTDPDITFLEDYSKAST